MHIFKEDFKDSSVFSKTLIWFYDADKADKSYRTCEYIDKDSVRDYIVASDKTSINEVIQGNKNIRFVIEEIYYCGKLDRVFILKDDKCEQLLNEESFLMKYLVSIEGDDVKVSGKEKDEWEYFNILEWRWMDSDESEDSEDSSE